jgi:hypothetical protein
VADQHEMLLATRTSGVLMGRVEAGCLDPSGSSQHSERWTEAGDNDRVEVNVRSVGLRFAGERDVSAPAAGQPG